MEGYAKTREKKQGRGNKNHDGQELQNPNSQETSTQKRIEKGETSEKTERGGDEIRIRKR